MESMAIYGSPSKMASSSRSRMNVTPNAKRPRSPPPAANMDAREGEDEREETPPPELDELYVSMRTDVVGVQYYAGLVGKGEYVMLRRQPHNQYDKNAVQVLNANGVQVGHIPRAVAAQAAWMMDEKLITVEGRMIGQNIDGGRHYKLGVTMNIYARPSLRSVLEPELVWATPGQKGFEAMRKGEAVQASPGSKGKGKARARGGDVGVGGSGGSGSGLPQAAVDPEMQKLLDGLRKVGEDEKHADGVMDALTGDIDASKLPMHPSPPGIASGRLTTDLLPHQSQALQWMIGQENPSLPATPKDPAVQFWVKQKAPSNQGDSEYWLNVATRTPQKDTPQLGRGGILADGMGLGKTLTVLSLALATKKEKAASRSSNATLIVCPLSVLSNWEKQLHDHVVFGGLTSYTYHGDAKGVTATTLESYDIVLTTYQSVTGDVPSSSLDQGVKKVKTNNKTGPLVKAKWKRVVADEGHVLKNPRAKMTQAFAALVAERRWICTGTPIVNSPSDLGSLLTCLQTCSPLDKPEYFKTLLLRPLKNHDPAAGKLLQALVGQVLLRRTKDSRDKDGNKLVELPPIEHFQVEVKLDDDTREVYDEILRASTEALLTGQSAANVLSMLTRMRQLCLSRQLVPQSFLDELRRPPAPAVKGNAVVAANIDPEKKEELIVKLRQKVADEEDCSICFEAPMRQPNITDCGHTYCFPCIDEWLHRDSVCPFCRHAVTVASLLALPAEESEFVEPEASPEPPAIRSAKIEGLIKYLKIFDQNDKTLVFSQFTKFLDLVAGSLKDEGIQYVRFDGSMNAKQRADVIAKFQRPVTDKNRATNPRVMLISLKSGAVGLNLTVANHVFLCDPWWQSAIEAQAIDRVHRRKPVRVYQLIAEDTIEAKVLDIQKRKDALVAKAFEKSSKGEPKKDKKQAKLEDLRELLGVK